MGTLTTGAPLDMDARVYAEMLALEDGHWWFSGLWNLVAQGVLGPGAPAGPVRVLDAGCGTGGTIARLRRARPDWSVTGVDGSTLALDLARRRGLDGLTRARVEALPFADATFDVATCLDVLYMDGVDDRRALAECFRVLRPAGVVAVNVPAFDWLRGAHDVACATRHRYTAGEVRELLTGAGFAVRRVSYWNATLFPLMALWRGLTRGGGRSDVRPAPAPINRALSALLAVETTLALRCGLPFGSSVFALAVKP